ncbi:Mbov_0398 family ICE element protein [Mesomycoplasma ovipneumoniae]|uniref:Mbov_0398 family ICE element protein n=1 Tax=Mesomycoplasma ovipneumoniae TaxID=29562 RepID=UPI00311AC5B3
MFNFEKEFEEKDFMEDEEMNDYEEKKLSTNFQFSSLQLKDLIKSVVDGINDTKPKSTKSKKTKKTKAKAKEKFNAEVPSFILKFSEKNEAKIINNFRTQAVAKKENPNKLLKYLILNTLTSENTLKYYSALKNDIYYSLRKAVYTSLSPFYLRLEEYNMLLEHKYDSLNTKFNVIINLLLDVLGKSQFDINKNKLDDLYIFNELKQKQEQEYLLLKKKNQARKKEIYESYKNYLLTEQVDQIINDEDQLIARPTSLRKIKSILKESYEPNSTNLEQSDEVEKETQSENINIDKSQDENINIVKKEEQVSQKEEKEVQNDKNN